MSAREEKLVETKESLKEFEKQEEVVNIRIMILESQATEVITEIKSGAETPEVYNLFNSITRPENFDYIALNAQSVIFRVLAISRLNNSEVLRSIVFNRDSSFYQRFVAIKNENCIVSQQELYELAKESPDDAKIALERLADKNLLIDLARNFLSISVSSHKWLDYEGRTNTDAILSRVLEKIDDDKVVGELALTSNSIMAEWYFNAINSQEVLYELAEKTFGNNSMYFHLSIRRLDEEHLKKVFILMCKNAKNLKSRDFEIILQRIKSLDVIKYFFFSDLSDIVEEEHRDAIKTYRTYERIRGIVIRKLAELA